MGVLDEKASQVDQGTKDLDDSGRILIVDDNSSLCKSLRMIFEKVGYFVVGALTGKEALTAANKMRFDIALLDIRLPDMDGTDLLSELSRIHPEMEFIVITGYASVETAVRAMEKQASAYLTKPLNIESTLDTIARIIEKKKLIDEKRKAELALADSETKYRALAENTTVGIGIIQGNPMKVVYANSAMEEITGYSPEEIESLDSATLHELIHPDERERVQAFYRARMSGEDVPNRYEIKIIDKNGELRHLLVGASLFDYDGMPASLVTFEDVTEARRAVSELKESELKYRTTLNSTGDPIHLIDKDYRMQLLNPAFTLWLEELGLDSDILGKSVFDAFPFLSYEVKEEYDRVFSTGKMILSVDIVQLNDREVTTETRKIPIFQGDQVVQILTMVRDITRQKEAEEAVRESEQWFRSIFRDSPIAINVFNSKGELIAANQAMLDFAGVSEVEDMTTLNIFDDPNTSDEIVERMRHGKTVLFEKPFDFELIKKLGLYPTTKGGIAYIQGGITPLRNESTGEIQGYVAQIVDETSKVETERELRESEVLFRSIFEQSPVAIEWFDVDGKLVRANQAALDLFGLASIDEYTGFDLYADPNTPDWVKANLRNGKSARFDLEFSFEKTRGSNLYPTWKSGIIYLDVLHTPLDIDGDGTTDGILSQIQDITERKRAEEELRAAKEFADTAINSQTDTFFVFDPSTGKAIKWNDAFRMASGYTDEEIATLPAPASYYDESDLAKASEYIPRILDGDDGTVEISLITKSGKRIPFEYSASLFQGNNGDSRYVVSVGRNVSDRKKAEEGLKSAADTATLYLDIMGHDIRNHLQAIVMATDIMSHYELSVEAKPVFELIVDSVENSQELIDQVQATRALLTTPLERISLSDSFAECTEQAAEIYSDVDFKITSEVKNAEVIADKFLKVLCENIIDNAVQHNTRKKRNVWLTLREKNDGYAVSVQDNGHGISDNRKESLFDAGRRFGGVGIHQSKNIVEKYGGSLSVGDRVVGNPSQGASFEIWLPKAREAPNGE
ncbi:MAG: PAS domain S-box protein [Candidatus Thorarchaeota archaeon]